MVKNTTPFFFFFFKNQHIYAIRDAMQELEDRD